MSKNEIKVSKEDTITYLMNSGLVVVCSKKEIAVRKPFSVRNGRVIRKEISEKIA